MYSKQIYVYKSVIMNLFIFIQLILLIFIPLWIHDPRLGGHWSSSSAGAPLAHGWAEHGLQTAHFRETSAPPSILGTGVGGAMGAIWCHGSGTDANFTSPKNLPGCHHFVLRVEFKYEDVWAMPLEVSLGICHLKMRVNQSLPLAAVKKYVLILLFLIHLEDPGGKNPRATWKRIT